MLNLSKNALSFALTQSVRIGDTDIFPPNFEYRALELHRDQVLDELARIDLTTHNISPCIRCLTPKHRFGFRVSTLLDPIDHILFTALVSEVAVDLDKSRLPPEKGPVSYRLKIDKETGQMFSPDFHFGTFTETAKQLAQSSGFVVMADIADFFPRVYHHRLKNALTVGTLKNNHVIAIDRIINSLNESYSYGIPVGSIASRFLAEVILVDVDNALALEGIKFVRFCDDFRLFASNQRNAQESLAFLARVLFENHGLTLQQHKTTILSKDKYLEAFAATEDELEITRLSREFGTFLESLGIRDRYGTVNLEDLTDEQRERLEEFNLVGIIEEQAERDEIDLSISRFALTRLAQTWNEKAIDVLLKNIDKFYPIFADIIRYIDHMWFLDEKTKRRIGDELLEQIDRGLATHLEFHRYWLYMLFARDKEFNHSERLHSLYATTQDVLGKRALILAFGGAGKSEWFRMHKRDLMTMDPWSRRAFIYGASCLPHDEFKHWAASIEPRLSLLERFVLKCARHDQLKQV